MEEARRVLERLDRIEALEKQDADPETVLEEVRLLLREAEAWVRAEDRGVDVAAAALARCRDALVAGEVRRVDPPLLAERGLW